MLQLKHIVTPEKYKQVTEAFINYSIEKIEKISSLKKLEIFKPEVKNFNIKKKQYKKRKFYKKKIRKKN